MSVGTISASSDCCGKSQTRTVVTYLYREGSVVYSLAKARKGIMEAIKIKRVRLITNRSTYGQIVTLYEDLQNGLWNEDELCTEAEAQQFVIIYLENLQQQIIQELSKC